MPITTTFSGSAQDPFVVEAVYEGGTTQYGYGPREAAIKASKGLVPHFGDPVEIRVWKNTGRTQPNRRYGPQPIFELEA